LNKVTDSIVRIKKVQVINGISPKISQSKIKWPRQ